MKKIVLLVIVILIGLSLLAYGVRADDGPPTSREPAAPGYRPTPTVAPYPGPVEALPTPAAIPYPEPVSPAPVPSLSELLKIVWLEALMR